MMGVRRSLAVVILLTLGPPLVSAQPNVRRAIPGAVTQTKAPRQPSIDTLQFYGGARGRTEADAIAGAKANAIHLAIARIAEVLFRNPDYPGLYGAQAVQDYVSRSGTFAETRVTRSGQAYHGYARFELKRGYTQTSTIREYAIPAQPPSAEAWGFFLVPVSLLTAAAVPLRVEVRAGQPANGGFVFHVSLRRREDRAVWIRLDSIRVIQDGAPGAASWMFEIWAKGQRVFLLPESRYDDRAGTYPISAEGTVRADDAGYIEFRVIGHSATLRKK